MTRETVMNRLTIDAARGKHRISPHIYGHFAEHLGRCIYGGLWVGEDSPIAKFLERNPSGGMHHICYEVDDIYTARDHLISQGARVLGDGEPRTGAHSRPVLFLHPKDFFGTLIELEQV